MMVDVAVLDNTVSKSGYNGARVTLATPFLILTLMEVGGQLHSLVTLPPRKEVLVSIGEESGGAPDLVWALQRRENVLPLQGIQSQMPSP
jgi:hypothetical protein